jgi:hypothetical protein
MGYASDLGTGIVRDICPLTGYPRTYYGHLLQTTDLHDGSVIPDWDKPGTKLPNFTSPYGHLEFAVGTGDDFYCFDYAVINAGPRGKFIILHATINSESGGFIEDAFHGYEVLPCNTMAQEADAIRAAFGMVDQALEWCAHNDIRHSTKGWNQNPAYFPICVARALRPYKFNNAKTGEPYVVRTRNTKAHKIARALQYGN